VTNAAIAYLNRDWLRHVDGLEALRLGVTEVVYAADDGVLLASKVRDAVGVSASDEACAERLLGLVQDMSQTPEMVVAHDPFSIRLAAEMLGMETREMCHQCALLPGEEIAPEPLVGFEFRNLEMSDAEFVSEHYTLGLGLEYVSDRIEQGVMIGAYPLDDRTTMAGFIGVHREGAMGLLEVLPPYRRLGLGESLTWHLIVQQLRNGNIPFGQIVEGNEASKAMSGRLGFTISEPCVAFMHPAA
jgi:tRNA (guanine37-N1)-methyltransferase